MILASLMPLPQARHLHDQVALDYAYDEDSSGREQALALGRAAWAANANPFHGLAESFGEGSYDSDMSLSESSYEEITQAALRAARREVRRRQRTRHPRSHSVRLFASPSPQIPEWENPCGGVYQPGEGLDQEVDSSSQGRVIKRRHLLALRNNTMNEYQSIRNSAKLEYRNFQHWQHEYKFLPNITRNSNAVKLKTWYRNMQTFVASFAFLGRAQYKYRKEHQQSMDAVTFELHELLVSARIMLCEIETTINASYPNSHGAKLTRVSREAMEERLKFHTPADGSQGADERDLQVTKERYLQYLDSVFKTLRRALRKQQRSSAERRHQGSRLGSAGAGAGAESSGLRAGSSESIELRSSGGGSGSGSECGSGEC
ncbi:hypothetical protein KR009_006820 [Drosophila setifemur]|nr:hypothetical protein KR009_006820 [Drosophila setifemur]